MIKEKKSYNIYILGNPILREDSIPIQIKPKLIEAFPHIQFIELDPTENFPDEKFLILIDTVINSKKIILIQDLSSLNKASLKKGGNPIITNSLSLFILFMIFKLKAKSKSCIVYWGMSCNESRSWIRMIFLLLITVSIKIGRAHV